MSAPPRWFHRPPWRYAALVAALYGGFWLLAALTEPFYLWDSADYVAQAEVLRGEAPPSDDPAAATRRPPGYPLFLAALFSVSQSPWWVAFVQSVLGVVNWLLLFDLLARFGLPRQWGWLVAGLALAPFQLAYPQMLMADLLFQSLVLGAVWAFVRYVLGGGSGWLAGYNALLAVAVLVKPVLMYFWVPNLLLLAWVVVRRERQWRRRWPVALALLLPAVVLGVSLVNEARTGYFHYTSIKGTNLFTHNAYRTMTRAYGEEQAVALMTPIEAEAAAIEDFGQRETFKEEAAARLIFDHLGTYLALHTQGMANVLLDPGRYDLYAFFGGEAPASGLTHAFTVDGYAGLWRALRAQPAGEFLLLVLLTLWNGFVLVASLFFLFDPRIPLPVRVAVFVLAGYLTAVTGPVGSARYRMTIYPLMLLAVPLFTTRLRAWRQGATA
ncbi:MAG: glycosyltransferase family 39 protein [Bacteroidota bacterium]